MKLLVFSDSHHHTHRMAEAIEQHSDASACFFLGDGLHDIQEMETRFPGIPFYIAQGNCDFAAYEPLYGLAPFGGLLFLYTHGHSFGVKHSTDQLFLAAKEFGANAALFGHTHVPFYECHDGVHLFNPGSISMPRAGSPSYGVITIKDGVPEFEVVLSGTKLRRRY